MDEKPLDERALDAILGEDAVDLDSTEDNDSAEDVIADESASEAPDDTIEPDEGGSEGSDDDAVEAEVVELEIDGELVEVPVKYKDHFLRQQDYTTKTQEVASQRKEVEVQQGEVALRKQQYDFAEEVRPDLDKARALEAQANQYHEHLRTNVDNLSATDITKLQMAITDSRSERDEIVNGIKEKQAGFQQAQEQSHKELLNKGTEVLKQRIPGWGKEHQEQVRQYAVESGYTEAELQGVVDPRQVETLWKARQYDALKSGVVPAVKAVQKAIQPKARNKMDQSAKDRLALNKIKKSALDSPKKAEAIMDSIADRFS